MSYLGDARAAIIAKGTALVDTANARAIQYVYPRLPESINGPALVLGQFTWTQIPGDRERTTYEFEMTLFIPKLGDDDATIDLADELIDVVADAFSKGITLNAGITTECVIRGGTANTWAKIGETIYLLVVFRLELKASRVRGYTA